MGTCVERQRWPRRRVAARTDLSVSICVRACHIISYVALHVSLIALPKKHDEREHGKDTIVPCARHLEVKSFSVRHHLLPKLRVRYAPRASQFSSPLHVRLAPDSASERHERRRVSSSQPRRELTGLPSARDGIFLEMPCHTSMHGVPSALSPYRKRQDPNPSPIEFVPCRETT